MQTRITSRFNEHTPRFWTKTPYAPIDPVEYFHPVYYGNSWGLAESDNSIPEIDFRPLKMEFFYFPEYRDLPPEEQRAARKKYLNVCDQIMYNLVVVKEPMSAEDIKNIETSVEYYDPPYVTIRRLQETNDRLEIQIAQLNGQIQELSVAEQELGTTQRKLSVAEQELGTTQRKLGAAGQKLETTQRKLSVAEQELGTTQRKLGAAGQKLETTQRKLSVAEQELTNIKSNAVLLQENLDRA